MKIRLVGVLMAFMCLSMMGGAAACHMDSSVFNSVNTKKIQLVSNPSTGYHWIASFNTKKVKIVKNSFKPSSKLDGSPGIETFIFHGSKGSKIIMELFKPGDNKPIKRVTYTI